MQIEYLISHTLLASDLTLNEINKIQRTSSVAVSGAHFVDLERKSSGSKGAWNEQSRSAESGAGDICLLRLLSLKANSIKWVTHKKISEGFKSNSTLTGTFLCVIVENSFVINIAALFY